MMRKLYFRAILAAFLLVSFCAESQTVNLKYVFGNYTLQPSAVSLITLTPLQPLGQYAGTNLVPVPMSRVTDTSGQYTYSNVVVGYQYSIDILANQKHYIYTNAIPVGTTNTSAGFIDAINYTGIAGFYHGAQYFAFFTQTNFAFTTNYLTITSNVTNNFNVTNNLSGTNFSVDGGTNITVATNLNRFTLNVPTQSFLTNGFLYTIPVAATNLFLVANATNDASTVLRLYTVNATNDLNTQLHALVTIATNSDQTIATNLYNSAIAAMVLSNAVDRISLTNFSQNITGLGASNDVITYSNTATIALNAVSNGFTTSLSINTNAFIGSLGRNGTNNTFYNAVVTNGLLYSSGVMVQTPNGDISFDPSCVLTVGAGQVASAIIGSLNAENAASFATIISGGTASSPKTVGMASGISHATSINGYGGTTNWSSDTLAIGQQANAFHSRSIVISDHSNGGMWWDTTNNLMTIQMLNGVSINTTNANFGYPLTVNGSIWATGFSQSGLPVFVPSPFNTNTPAGVSNIVISLASVGTNGLATTNYVNTATNGFATTNYVGLNYYPTSNPSLFVPMATVTNFPYFYPTSNPSLFVTAGITNGYLNSNGVVSLVIQSNAIAHTDMTNLFNQAGVNMTNLSVALSNTLSTADTIVSNGATRVYFFSSNPSNSVTVQSSSIGFNTNGMTWINRNGNSANWLVLITTNR